MYRVPYKISLDQKTGDQDGKLHSSLCQCHYPIQPSQWSTMPKTMAAAKSNQEILFMQSIFQSLRLQKNEEETSKGRIDTKEYRKKLLMLMKMKSMQQNQQPAFARLINQPENEGKECVLHQRRAKIRALGCVNSHQLEARSTQPRAYTFSPCFYFPTQIISEWLIF